MNYLDDPVCSCGHSDAEQTSEHFLLQLPLFNNIRNKTINKIDANERNISTLMSGNDQLHLFVRYSPRFLVPNWTLINLVNL